MLNWEEIAARIDNPHLCSPNEVQDLKDFCDKFPYSQVFPLLYLKVLSKGNHIQFEEELEKYAHKITNRVQLYNLLYVKQDTDISIEADFQNGIPEVQVDENEVINTEITTIKIQESISAIASEKLLEDIVEEKNESHEDELHTEVDELNMEIIASSVTASFVLETREETSAESELPEFDMSISDDLELIDLELDEFHNSDLNGNTATERTFLQWLTNSPQIEINE